MKERPILFNAEMVRAILEGRKTQTRRVITKIGQFKEWIIDDQKIVNCQDYLSYHEEKHGFHKIEDRANMCPYGAVGDRLWVRETWKLHSFVEGWPLNFQYQADGAVGEENSNYTDSLKYENWYEKICTEETDYLYKINWPDRDEEGYFVWEHGKSPLKWRPSIFMPRWASRITLEITDVRVERVQDISEEDAIAEGCLLPKGYEELCKLAGGHRAVFRDLWDSINAKRGFGWDSNPLVWVISFKLIERNNDAERTV